MNNISGMHGAAILHHCTAIKDISANKLFNESLTELPTVLDSFKSIPKVFI